MVMSFVLVRGCAIDETPYRTHASTSNAIVNYMGRLVGAMPDEDVLMSIPKH